MASSMHNNFFISSGRLGQSTALTADIFPRTMERSGTFDRQDLRVGVNLRSDSQPPFKNRPHGRLTNGDLGHRVSERNCDRPLAIVDYQGWSRTPRAD